VGLSPLASPHAREGDDVELTVLGSAGSHPGVGRVCSGYLVRHGPTAVLLDAGNGATANLQRYLPIADLDAIAISHRHVDHCIDLIGAFYALRFDPAFDRRVPLYAPPEVADTLTTLMSADSAMGFDEVFDHHLVGHGDTVEVGGLTLSFATANHPPPSVSMRLEAAGRTLVYSGDTGGGPELEAIAAGADLLLCEATWHGDLADHPPDLHLTGAAAAEVARTAGVGRLVLTHVAGGSDRARVLAEAAAVYDGPVSLAEDLTTYLLT
jgi:ribonuclease BN (tRNA processing enzyme)